MRMTKHSGAGRMSCGGNDTPQPDLISEKSSISGTPGMKENSEDIFVEGLSEIDEQAPPGKRTDRHQKHYFQQVSQK